MSEYSSSGGVIKNKYQLKNIQIPVQRILQVVPFHFRTWVCIITKYYNIELTKNLLMNIG